MGEIVYGSILLFCFVALGLLWVRGRSLLDLWLAVTLWATVLKIALTGVLPADRFSLGHYASRVYSLATSSVLLISMLSEATTLYVRLARSMTMQRREREVRSLGLDAMTGTIVHEINQPLGAISLNGNAARRWLAKTPPNLAEAQAALDEIIRDSHRVSEITTNIRGLFKHGTTARSLCDVNEIIRSALAIESSELQSHRVSIEFRLDYDLSQVLADRIQLHQVMINLITNAVEAMRSVTDRARVLRVTSETRLSGGVLITVENTGTGIDSDSVNKLFQPLFTTKPQGMGMGLWICRAIVEAHNGQLTTLPPSNRGSVFQIALPAE